MNRVSEDRVNKDRAEIFSLNIGAPKVIHGDTKTIFSGIYKDPVNTRVYLSKLNFTGDAQGDLVNHGGIEKAICVYAYEHYPFWEKELQRKLSFGAFGENLTIRGMLEEDVCIGDTFQLGEATVQLSQPRQPCYKLSVKHGVVELPVRLENTGFTGFYLRVLKEGFVAKEDGLIRIQCHPQGITVSYANQIMHHERNNKEAMRKILSVEELSIHWRATFSKRLSGEETNVRERLTGEK